MFTLSQRGHSTTLEDGKAQGVRRGSLLSVYENEKRKALLIKGSKSKLQFTELHLHDHYSVLDGLNTASEYMVRAVELGMTHIAETNHGTLSGHREFQREAKKAGITPILGLEAYISDTDRFDRRAKNKREDGTSVYNHIGLLAMNENGLKNLNAMSAEAWLTGFYNKPRIDRELLEQFGDDIIVTSGCLNGLLSKALEAGNYDRALERAKWFVNVFGERFFIEIQGHNPPEINAGLMKISEDTGALVVVTSDCHYARKEDLWITESMLILSTSPKMNPDFDFSKSQKMGMLERFNYLYPDRTMTFQEYEIYLRSATEQMELLAKQGIGTEPITNTMIVADMIGDYPYYENLDLLPTLNISDPKAELRRKAFEGYKERIAEGNCQGTDEEVARLEEELKVIGDKGFDPYFLNLDDFVRWARGEGIFIGPGRGSAVSSFLCYCLHVTNINPIEKKLLFFRFLDPERDDWPDVDVDFDSRRRHEVKDYVKRKHGYVANIGTFGYYGGKSAIKAAARVFKIPIGEVNKATKMIDSLEQYETSAYTAEFRNKYPEVLKLAKQLEGRIQNTGMHAGGTVISKEPIENYVPMQTAKDPQDAAADRVPVMGYDMHDASEIGLIKYDILGLNTLTVILDTIAHIKRRHDIDIDPYKIPLDDEKVYKMLSRGRTKGVFQCEGGPYTKLLISMGGIDNFDDLVATNALVRPGAAKSSIGENYLKGKNEGEFEYIHADTKYFTEETFGQILFQEQQMLLCTEVAGMSMREANQVRQAIGKKIAEKLALYKDRFIDGATKKIGARKAKAVWEDLEKSAEYAFNKAHSEGYSLLSYWTAWLKANYPTEYMCSLLESETNTASPDKDKILDYLMEAKKMGIRVLLPHVNHSDIGYTIEDGALRMGLSAVKYISGKVGSKIIAQRPYASYSHLLEVSKTKGSGINSRAIDALNKVGAAAFEDNPKTGNERDNFYEFLNIPAFDSSDVSPHIIEQFRPLDEFTEDDTFVVMAMVRNIRVGKGWALVDMVDESGAAGCFTDPNTPIEKGKMYVMLISNNRVARYITTDELNAGEGGAFAKFLEKDRLELEEGEYRCISFAGRKAKSGNKFANAVFADAEKNLTAAMVFSSVYEKAMMPCTTASKIRPVFAETRDGGLYLKELITK